MGEGARTTPFDMTMLNDLDRFHLVMDGIDARPQARAYTRGFGDDLPEVHDWTWPGWET